MDGQILAYLGFIAAGVACLGLVYLNKQLAACRAEAQEKDRQREALEAPLKSAQEKAQLAEAKLQEMQKKVAKLEKDLEAQHRRSAQHKEELARVEEEHKKSQEQLERQLEHFQCQTEALTAQIQEVDGEKRELRLQLQSASSHASEKQERELSTLREQLKKLRLEHKEAERQLSKQASQLQELQGKLASGDTPKLKQALAKLSQYHHLYQLMRGRKELLEERNQNWELALRLLCHWVLTQLKPQAPLPEGLGALVAQALEATKQGSLVNDEFALGSPSKGTADESRTNTQAVDKKPTAEATAEVVLL